MAQQAEHSRTSSGPSRLTPGSDLLELLAARIESLVDRFQAAQQRIDNLNLQLSERENQIREMSQALESARGVRREVSKRVDRLMAQVERLEQAQA